MEPRPAWQRWGWGVALGLALVCLLFLWMLAQYEIGRVESIDGTSAVVSVERLDRTFTAEVVDADLEVGATVVLNVAGDDAALVATSPGMVRFIVGVKKFLPQRPVRALGNIQWVRAFPVQREGSGAAHARDVHQAHPRPHRMRRPVHR